MRRRKIAGFTLIEAVIASGIAAFTILATLSLLGFCRMRNEIEQERARAHQIVCQKLEIERYQLFTWTQSGEEVTIWDNGTPADKSDDTIGKLEIFVTNAATGAVLTAAPDPAVLLQIEATLTWRLRGGRLSETDLRETAITFKAP